MQKGKKVKRDPPKRRYASRAARRICTVTQGSTPDHHRRRVGKEDLPGGGVSTGNESFSLLVTVFQKMKLTATKSLRLQRFLRGCDRYIVTLTYICVHCIQTTANEKKNTSRAKVSCTGRMAKSLVGQAAMRTELPFAACPGDSP